MASTAEPRRGRAATIERESLRMESMKAERLGGISEGFGEEMICWRRLR